jgi:hypothetical protein
MAYTTIDDPSKYFQNVLYTGNGGTNAITFGGNSNMQPDFVWIKCRANSSTNHFVWDSSRGVHKYLSPSQDAAEGDDSASLTAFGSDGFTMGDGGAEMNHSDGRTYVGWGWKCNGGTEETTVTESGNNPGNTRQTNTTAGFSIIKYVGTGAAGTIAHGLGVAPHFIIHKSRDGGTENWPVYHIGLGNTHGCDLNRNVAKIDNATLFNDTSPTSSVFTVTSDSAINYDGDNIVAWAWTSIQGFSKFGSYKGNYNADGPFIYTGFKPAFVLVKEADNANDWDLRDSARDPQNHVDTWLRPNSSDADGDSDAWDFLSNGFKIRQASNRNNRNDGTMIYMAFAESPFVSSKGVPCTAR